MKGLRLIVGVEDGIAEIRGLGGRLGDFGFYIVVKSQLAKSLYTKRGITLRDGSIRLNELYLSAS